MILKQIEIVNYRLHKNTLLNFSNNLNYIVGGNGQGKTTILEAIYYLCTTKNLNQFSDYEAVNFDENYFELFGLFSDLTENKVKIDFKLETNRKEIFLDNKQIYKAASLIGQFPVVTLIQSDHSITQGSPSFRRKFIDSVISQASETYLKVLLDYNKTLRQRSSLLSKFKETNNKNLLIELDAWTDTLISTGIEIVKHRIEFVKEFNSYLREAYFKLVEKKEQPQINYSFLECSDKTEIETAFKEALEDLKEAELRRAVNLVGPHRDDFVFKVNELELKNFGSQGQHKTFQIALRFGQFYFLKDKLGKTPIFLMDDVFGELDAYRVNKTSNYLREVGQAFITLTDFSNLDNLVMSGNDKMFKVEKGNVSYV